MDLKLFPPELLSRAVTVGSEVAWPAAVARDVVAHLQGADIAVLGVEVWMLEDAIPRVWGWSDYEVEFDGDWDRYVKATCAEAIAELQKEVPPEALVQLTIAEPPTSK